MEVSTLEIGDHVANGIDRRVDERRVLVEERHADHHLKVRLLNGPQSAKDFDAAFPTPGESAHRIMKLPWPIDADRGHQSTDAATKDAHDQTNGSITEPAGCGKIQQ